MAARTYVSPLDGLEDCLRALESVHPKDRKRIVDQLYAMSGYGLNSDLDWICRGAPPGESPKIGARTRAKGESET